MIFSEGDPVPWFRCDASSEKDFNLSQAAGRIVVLFFFGSSKRADSAAALEFITRQCRNFFDDATMCFFGVGVDHQDEQSEKVKQMLPGIRYFWDFTGSISSHYGALEFAKLSGQPPVLKPYTLILDRNLRVLAQFPLKNVAEHNQQVQHFLQQYQQSVFQRELVDHAPVLVLPRVFSKDLCQRLIACYQQHGGKPSGFMSEQEGYTVARFDTSFKRRKDVDLDAFSEYRPLALETNDAIAKRLVPEVKKFFQFTVTHIERHLVACYDAEEGGFFRAHRDNTTKGTAHRRFAVTLNLNAEEYEGGDLRFAEFGAKTYRAPTGGAVVFSCSMMHEAMPVTSGTRYAFLPFLYDEAAAEIRQQNLRYLKENDDQQQ